MLMISNMLREITGITVMIITIMPIQPVSAGFTTRTCMAAITMIITPMHIGTTRIHGITDSAFIWDITGGELVSELVMIHGILILITGMGMGMVTDILIMGMDMAADMVAADTTITITLVITTVMTITPLTTDTAVLLPAQEAVRVLVIKLLEKDTKPV